MTLLFSKPLTFSVFIGQISKAALKIKPSHYLNQTVCIQYWQFQIVEIIKITMIKNQDFTKLTFDISQVSTYY